MKFSTESNNYMVINIDHKIQEGNNAHATIIHGDDEFINFIKECGNNIDKLLIIKNNEIMTPYECKRMVEVHEYTKKIWNL